MKKLEGKSQDILEDNISKIKELFPEVFEEGKIDFEQLKKILGNFVDSENEKYSFTWNGKSEAIKTALRPTSATLRPDKESSKNWDKTENIFIEGDNLEVLKVLQDTYRNKIKMIYIDPPYNTGHDFVYNDDFKESEVDYRERTNQAMVSNPQTNGRYHTDWLNMMYPRLRLARNLLKDDGVIFISINDNEIVNLKKVCDEIFGEDNVEIMIWKKVENDSGKLKITYRFRTEHEYILVGYKNKEKTFFKKFLAERNYKNIYNNPDNDPRGEYKQGIISTTEEKSTVNGKNYYKVITPSGKEFIRQWRCDSEEFQKLRDDNRIYFGKKGDSVPSLKVFINEMGENTPVSILEGYGTAKTAGLDLIELFKSENKVFDYPKPVSLIKHLIQISSELDSLVLDFFAGSGTTAQALLDLNADDEGNRKFIMVQLPEETDKDSEAHKAGYKYISDISMERIRRAGEKIIEENKDKEGIDKLDIGFKAFKLDSTNITLWDENSRDLEGTILGQIESVKPDRSSDDVLYEVLLKYGIDLSTPITEERINGKKVYSIAGGYLLACLDKEVDLETISKIAEKKPQRVVFYDHGFKTDMVKLNAEQTLKKAGIEDIRII